MKPEKWYSYATINAVTNATCYVTVSETDAIATGRALRPGVSPFAALEAFLSAYAARETLPPGYLAARSPGAILRAHIVDLGANGVELFSAQVKMTAKEITRLMEDKDVIFPKYVLKRIGLRREMVAYPISLA